MTIVRSPIDGRILQEVREYDADDVTSAVDRAVVALRSWRASEPSARRDILLETARLIRENADELALLECDNTGKLLVQTRNDVERAAMAFDYNAGQVRTVAEEVPLPGEMSATVVREPRGVTVGIIPWNAPILFAAKKLAPALAHGNVMLLKPAEETPLTALRLGELLERAGLPRDVAQIITGGIQAGSALVGDPRADIVVFTGSVPGGRAVATEGGRNLTPVVLELGGKSAQIVFDDASVDSAVEGIMKGIFTGSGQLCIAGSRLIVQEGIYDEVLSALTVRTRALRVGDPREPGVDVGPQTTPAQQAKSLAMIEAAIGQGVDVLAQAELPQEAALAGGWYVPPTVIRADPRDEIAQEEVFGPVLTVLPFRTEEEALELAQDTRFGLAAGVWTADDRRAARLAGALDVGIVWINGYLVLSDQVPFGGVKDSGFGREGGASSVENYTRLKSIWTPSTAPALQD